MAEVGRPTVMTEEVLAKLEDAFSVGATDKEAIFIAGISKDAFYDYCKANPAFSERKEALKDMPKFRARKNIVEKVMSGDLDTSKWYAERKIKDEFSQRTENTGKDGEPMTFQVVSFDDYNSLPVQPEQTEG